jgi:hypothetical protein
MDADDNLDGLRICACPGCEEEAAAGHGGEAGHVFCHACEAAGCTPEKARCGNEDLFPLGMVVATPGALIALVRGRHDVIEFLARHQHGDWGAVGQEESAANDAALREGRSLISEYQTSEGARLWIVTEGDRSATTLLLPEEY